MLLTSEVEPYNNIPAKTNLKASCPMTTALRLIDLGVNLRVNMGWVANWSASSDMLIHADAIEVPVVACNCVVLVVIVRGDSR
mmetsp:Transcript_11747/g.18050  ORF Transcript_11747/g.18050 Transcript_11747/m.18050 type:complete len:83 (-) Transcript_11747:75-323(-)